MDPDLSRADGLIKEKQYDEAILVLSEYIKAHPENFDPAQQRLRQIVKVRDEYNITADELLDTIANEPDNAEKILALARRLEALESPRNRQVQSFIARTRDLAQFAANRNRLMRILEEGRALAAAGDFQKALQTYAGGMDIYRDEFFAAGYGEIIENRVRQGIADIDAGIAAFPSIAAPLNAAAADLVQAAQREAPDSAAGVSRIGELYRRLIPAMDQLIAFQMVLGRTAGYFDEQLAQFQQVDSTIGDRSFLSFASRLIRGSGEAEDGMLAAVEAYWNQTVSGAENAVADLAGRSYAAALSAALNEEYGRAREQFEYAGGYIQYPLALLEKQREFSAAGGAGEQIFFDQPVERGRAENFLQYQAMNRAIGYLVEGANTGGAFISSIEQEAAVLASGQQDAVNAEAAMEREGRIREAAGGLLAGIQELSAQVDGEITVFRNYQNSIEDPQGRDAAVTGYFNDAHSLIGDIRARILNRDYESAIRFYTMANGDLERRLNSRQTEYDEGNRLIQGIPRDEAGGGGNIDHFPSEGLVVLTRMEQAIAADTQRGSALLRQYEAEDRETLGSGDIRGLYTSAQNLVQGLENLMGRGRGLAATARNQASQGEALRRDGERLYQEARNALGRNNFDVARDRIQRATDRFNASLAIQESASLRAEWDTQVVSLAAEINRLENEIVIRDVRNLVNNARTAYFAGNFDQAEDLLVRAQNRWKVTNFGEDSEVQYWITVVRGALSLRSGRVIPPTAPLYAEMSQLLSDAKKNYDEGVRYLNANRRAEGLAKFTEARQKTQEVKLMFPVNQEAGILELRMDQVTDPAAFNTLFDRRFTDAVAGTKAKSVESFAELQNLAEINPRYPGMAAALIQAEIDMGYRPPPPDPRALARSNELTAAARRILEGNNRSQFEIALRQLDEALTLNPNNTQAMSAKDQIQTRMNGTGTIVLNSRSEAEYQRAVSELQRGNTLVALAIVEQLLQDPQNRTSTRITDLQRRIQSLL